jgi:hypothetical protein
MSGETRMLPLPELSRALLRDRRRDGLDIMKLLYSVDFDFLRVNDFCRSICQDPALGLAQR